MNKKELIFDSVLKNSLANGLSDTPMSKIAKEANVAAGTIYRYFDSKEHLLLELYNSIADDLSNTIELNYDSHNDIKTNIYSMWKSILLFYLNNPLKVRFMEEYKASYNNSNEVVSKSKEIYELFSQVVHDAINQNIIKQISCSVISSFILGPISQLFSYHENKISIVDDSIIDEAFSILWDGIKSNN